MVVLASVLFAVALGAAAAGLAFSASDPQVAAVTARLVSAGVVPRPAGVPHAATGAFSARTVPGSAGSWFLSYRSLGSEVISAHVHVGRQGVRGPIALTLCSRPRCAALLRGTNAKIALGSELWKAMQSGRAYVDVHTRRNPLGEIRGPTLGVQTALAAR